MNTDELNWIDCEGFEPLDSDNLDEKKFKAAIKKGYSALCDDCYIKECLKNSKLEDYNELLKEKILILRRVDEINKEMDNLSDDLFEEIKL